jgi:ATP-dependent DNA ligase
VPFDHPDWLFEPKYDGFHGLLHVTPTDATFLSKRRLTLKQFASLADEIRDGAEIVREEHRREVDTSKSRRR